MTEGLKDRMKRNLGDVSKYNIGRVTLSAKSELSCSVKEMSELFETDGAIDLGIAFHMAVSAKLMTGCFSGDVNPKASKLDFDPKDKEEFKIYQSVIGLKDVAFNQFLIDLAACHQVRELSKDNYKNYFKGKGIVINNVTGINIVVSIFAGSSAGICGDDELREYLSKDDFIRYHTTYSSSAVLCLKMIDSLGDNIYKIVSKEEVKAVQESHENYWSREHNAKISTKMLALTCVFLKVNGILPENWYQGFRALSAVPVMTSAPAAVLFTRHKELSLREAIVGDITDLATLWSKVSTEGIEYIDDADVIRMKQTREISKVSRAAVVRKIKESIDDVEVDVSRVITAAQRELELIDISKE